ncbi:hypothetical protein FCV25MIE_17272 [Fagus crenata]
MDRLRYCVCLISILVLFMRSHARPLNPSMEENQKNQPLSMTSLSALVKVSLFPSTPSPWSNDIGNNHEILSGSLSVHGEVAPLDKGYVPPSAPSPGTVDGHHDEQSGGKCPPVGT